MTLNWLRYSYNLNPIQLSYGRVTERESIIVALSSATHIGFGELIMVPYYDLNIESILQQLQHFKRVISHKNFDTTFDFYDFLKTSLGDQHFLISALDCAYWDLKSKTRNSPLYKYLGSEIQRPIVSALTLSISDIDTCQEYLDWPILKIKMGYDGGEKILHKILDHSDAKLIIDANRGWTWPQCKSILRNIDPSRLLYLEEPFAQADVRSYKAYKKFFKIPLLADESFQTIADLEQCAHSFDSINIKLMKCGGISPALDIIKKARAIGLGVVGGCMMGSAISVLPIIHLNSKLDLLDADGSYLIKDKPWGGIELVKGQIQLANKAGIGLKIEPFLADFD